MPDTSQPSNTRWAGAIEEIEHYLFSQFPEISRISDADLSKYKLRLVKLGWRLNVSFADENIALDILVPPNFPWRPVRIALATLQRTLIWPHVEDDGVLCIYAEADEFIATNPIASLKRALSDAIKLIESSIAGANREDFRTEFQPYWNRKKTIDTKVFSLVSPGDGSPLIKIWYSENEIIIANTEDAIRTWVKNKLGIDPRKNILDGLSLVLPTPLYPEEYPEKPSQIMELARSAGSEATLAELLQVSPTKLLILLQMQTPNGVAMGSVRLAPPKAHRIAGKAVSGDPLYKGFRPGNVPPEILARRYLGGGSIDRLAVQRIDSSWLHGRDQDPYHLELRKKRVAILGCGSMGSLIAAQLAAAGVGDFLLIDPDTMAWENVGRHYLGVEHVGEKKTQALANVFRKDYPHIKNIDTWEDNWEMIPQDDPRLHSCDLLISAIGSWGAEGALNEWHVFHNREKPIIYTWLEPHALASHSVAILKKGGCFACQLSPYGVPKFKVTEWPVNPARQEAACGAFFQPYGALELADGVTMTSKLIIDTLLGKLNSSSVHTWIGRVNVIHELGGNVTSHWQDKITSHSQGEFVSVWDYTQDTECFWCTKK